MADSYFRFRMVSDNSIKGLMNDEVYGTTPDQFNDPYDTLFQYDTEKLYNLLINDKESFDLLAKDVQSACQKNNPKYSLNNAMEFIKNKELFLPLVGNYFLDILGILRKQMLIACFCNSVTKEIMWSHYTNYGKGFAVEYDSEDIKKLIETYMSKYKKINQNDKLEDDTFGLKKVDYSGSRFDGTEVAYNQIKELLRRKMLYRNGTLTDKKYILDKDTFKKFVLYKDKSWEYENETRLVLPNNDESKSFGLLGIIKPKAIYLGEFISFNDTYVLCNIARTKKIPVYKMISSLDKKRFGLTKKKISVSNLKKIVEKFEDINFF